MGVSNGNLQVHQLISPDRTWKEVEVRVKFPSFEADIMLDIHLMNHISEDVRFWKWSTKGHYTVKSRYLFQIGCFNPPDFQSVYYLETWWKMLWKLNIPHNVRIFFWRASNELIPAVVNIFRRNIHANGCCFYCGTAEAATIHCLLFCPLVRDSWKDTIFWHCLKKCRLLPFISCGLTVKDHYSFTEFEHFIRQVWTIWKEICNVKHNGQSHNKNNQG